MSRRRRRVLSIRLLRRQRRLVGRLLGHLPVRTLTLVELLLAARAVITRTLASSPLQRRNSRITPRDPQRRRMILRLRTFPFNRRYPRTRRGCPINPPSTVSTARMRNWPRSHRIWKEVRVKRKSDVHQIALLISYFILRAEVQLTIVLTKPKGLTVRKIDFFVFINPDSLL